MPTSVQSLTFKLVQGTIPAFGDQYEDITRKGSTTTRMRWVGKGATETEVVCHRFYATWADAMSGVRSIEAAKGKEWMLVSQLHNQSWRVFVVDAAVETIRRIECTLPSSDYKVVARLRVRRVG